MFDRNPWRLAWWQPLLIALIFLFIVAWFLPEPFGAALAIASVLCGVILARMDRRAKYEHLRNLYLRDDKNQK